MGYFRSIRHDFPEQFYALAKVESEIGPSAYILRHQSGPNKGERFSLYDLPAGPIDRKEHLPDCGLFCETAEREYSA
jgi:hypothetical protein